MAIKKYVIYSALVFITKRRHFLFDFEQKVPSSLSISGAIHEINSFNSIYRDPEFNLLLRHKELLLIIEENLQTNMTFEQMLDIQRDYKKSINTIETLTFEEGVGELKDGIWYYMMNENEFKKISEEINEHLEMQ